jgi:hypothetical protein
MKIVPHHRKMIKEMQAQDRQLQEKKYSIKPLKKQAR